MQLSFLQSLLSYLVPVRVLQTESAFHRQLELYRYRGRWQLATADAFYSDGAAYAPLRKAFQALGKGVFKWKEVLVLGAGIGSAVTILDKKYLLRPQLTLVDIDEEILTIAGRILAADGHADHVELICEDAGAYVLLEARFFDVVILDVFQGRVVPAFALQKAFLQSCTARLRPGGVFILNYIINEEPAWQRLQHTLEETLPQYQTLAHGINRVVLWQKP